LKTPTDTEILDWIEKQGNGDKWVARQSVTGRGFRLHNTSGEGWGWLPVGGYRTAREAAIAAMEESERNRN